MKQIKNKTQSGFTLVELIIVIVVITILAAAILVGINPALRFQQARDSQRWSEVNSILNGIMTYKVDNAGSLPAGLVDGTPVVISLTPYTLGTDTTGCNAPCTTSQAACIDLSTPIVGGGYLSDIPRDPSVGDAGNTGYQVQSTGTGGVKITACGAEGGTTISVQR